jgi:outer membrane receptor for ferric coprogen and ferric-rhodotorulic acid
MNPTPSLVQRRCAHFASQLLALVLIAADPLTARAQTAAAPAASGPVVDLPTFNVRTEKDEGYIAADTISGGRLSTNVLKTPSDLTVLTREFLDDIGANNLHEAGVWLTNSTVTPPTERDFGASVGFRGLPSGNSTRNYFYYPTTADDYIVERLEGSRGPNAIIYGDALSGGQYNILIKRATFTKDFTKATVRLDSEGSRRVTVDSNQVLGKQLAVRFNGVAQQRRTWVDAFKDDRYAGHLTGSYRPWRGSEIRGEVEFGYSNVSVINANFTDSASLWDRLTTVDAPLTAAPAASTGLSRFTADQLVISPSFGGVINLRNFARTSGTNLRVNDVTRALFPAMTPLPRRSFSAQPPDATLGTHFRTLSLFAEHTFDNKLTVEIAVQDHSVNRKGVNATWGNVLIDVNSVLPDGRPNPNFRKVYSEGSIVNAGETPNYVTNSRVAAAYPLEVAGIRQTFSAVAQRRVNVFEPEYFRFSRTNGAVLDVRNAANVVNFRQYWDAPTAALLFPTSPDAAGNQYGWVKSRDTREYSTLESLQLNTIGEYFGDKLTVIGGYRRDIFDFDSRNIATFDAAGYPATDAHNIKHARVDTKSIGATYFPIPSLGVYVARSEGFAPNTLNFPDVTGAFSIPLTTNVGRSAGLRFRLLDGKVVGSAGYYESVEADRPAQASGSSVNQIWLDLGLPAQQIGGGAFTTFLDTFDYKAHGWELDLTANLSRDFKLKFNVAFPTTEQNNGFPRSKAYYDANIAQWRAGANDLNNPNRARIASNIAAFEAILSGTADGRSVNATYKYRANLFGTYRVASGPLKGLRLGGGANLFGRQLISNQVNLPYDYIFQDQYVTATATLGYGVKLFGRPVDLQLNVTNLFDYAKPVYSGTATFNGVAYLSNYSYVEPRRVMLTVGTSF